MIEFVKEVVKINGEYLLFAANELKHDLEIVELALKSYPDVIHYISDRFTVFISNAIGKRPLKQSYEDEIEGFEQSLKSKFIFHSNAIEGNTLTLNQTIQILDTGEIQKVEKVKVREILEVKNHGDAFSELFAQVFLNHTIDLTIIKGFHKILMASLIENASEIRKHGVGITGRKTMLAHYLELSSLMEKFIDYINSPTFTNFHPISQACLIHYNFVKIHPFSDGNGYC